MAQDITPSATPWAVTEAYWSIGAAGASCTTTCAASGGCVADAFDATPSPGELAQIAAAAGVTACAAYLTDDGGNSISDPALYGGSFCYNQKVGMYPSCGASNLATSQRFCPCKYRATSTPTVSRQPTPSHTPSATYWNVLMGHWVIGPAGASCNTTCAAAGGCAAKAFDATPSQNELAQIAAAAGVTTCSSFVSDDTGNYVSNPAFESGTCYNRKVGFYPTCGATKYNTTQRFCPCVLAATGTPSSSNAATITPSSSNTASVTPSSSKQPVTMSSTTTSTSTVSSSATASKGSSHSTSATVTPTPSNSYWAVTEAYWMIGAAGVSCTTACAAVGGCVADAFDATPNNETLSQIAAAAGVSSCSAYVTDDNGLFVSDPALYGDGACYNQKVGMYPTCGATRNVTSQRFCPCKYRATPTPSMSRRPTPSHTPTATYWDVLEAHWIAAPVYSSCDEACIPGGGCMQSAFDATPSAAEVGQIAAAVGLDCVEFYPASWSSSDPLYVDSNSWSNADVGGGAAAPAVWQLGANGVSCDTACSTFGTSCKNTGFPTTPTVETMQAIMDITGVTCNITQYEWTKAPVLQYGNDCVFGLRGSGSSSCSQTTTSYRKRFCPCAAKPFCLYNRGNKVPSCSASEWRSHGHRLCPCARAFTPSYTPSNLPTPSRSPKVTLTPCPVGYTESSHGYSGCVFNAQSVSWIRGAPGLSCTTACARYGGCVQSAFDNDPSPVHLQQIAQAAGYTCNEMLSTTDLQWQSDPAVCF